MLTQMMFSCSGCFLVVLGGCRLRLFKLFRLFGSFGTLDRFRLLTLFRFLRLFYMFSDCFRLFEVVLDWSGRLGCSSCLTRFGLLK